MSVGTLAPDSPSPDADTRSFPRAITIPVAIVAGLTALAAALRFVHLGHQGFWYDEANTAVLMHLSPTSMLRLIPNTESTPPLYYCVLWVWAKIFGSGEVGLRSFSALAGVATVPVMYAATAKLISRRAGLVAAALTACNPFLIWYSQEARSYSLLALLGALSLCAFAYAREDQTPRRLAVWAIASALALATHYYAALLVVPEAVVLLAGQLRVRRVQLAVGAVGLCGLALIPLAISQNGTGHASWIGPIPLSERLGQVPHQLLIGTGAPAAGLLFILGVVAVVLAVGLIFTRAEGRERLGARLAGGLAAGGVAINIALIVGGTDDMITRNIIVLWLPAAVLVTAGLAARRAGLLGLAGAATLCSIGIVAVVGVAVDRNLQRPDWRTVAHALGPRPPAGAVADRAILLQHDRTRLPLSLYMPGLLYLERRHALVSELDVIAISSPRVKACWWGAACNLISSKLPTSLPIPGFHISGPVIHAHQFSVLRLRASKPIRIDSRIVSRALTTTTLRFDVLLFQRPA